jgi:aspartate-semialdehyde dehydrogenase
MPSLVQQQRIAIAGATGLVGRELLRIAEQSSLQHDPGLFASAGSVGRQLPYSGRGLPVSDLAECDYTAFDAVFFCVGDELSARYVPGAVDAGCLVVDKSNAFRLNPTVPLVVAGVNDPALDANDRLAANPNCSTIILTHALGPLQEHFGLRGVWTATYQSISGAGLSPAQDMLETLRSSPSLDALVARPELDANHIALNVIPKIGALDDTDRCGEETKLVRESRKVLALPKLPIVVHAVRVPVAIGHSLAVTVELGRAVTALDITAVWSASTHLRVMHDTPPTPLSSMRHVQVEIGRLRQEEAPNTWSFFISGDNLTLGAALNGWRIFELAIAKSSQAHTGAK